MQFVGHRAWNTDSNSFPPYLEVNLDSHPTLLPMQSTSTNSLTEDQGVPGHLWRWPGPLIQAWTALVIWSILSLSNMMTTFTREHWAMLHPVTPLQVAMPQITKDSQPHPWPLLLQIKHTNFSQKSFPPQFPNNTISQFSSTRKTLVFFCVL